MISIRKTLRMRGFVNCIPKTEPDSAVLIVKVTKKRGIPAFLFGFTAEKIRAIFFNCVSVSENVKNGVLYE